MINNVFLGIYPTDNFGGTDALIVSLVAILLVFLVLLIIILVAAGINIGVNKVEGTFTIKPRKENKIIDEDPDALVAALTATIDYNKETGKNTRLVSISRVDE